MTDEHHGLAHMVGSGHIDGRWSAHCLVCQEFHDFGTEEEMKAWVEEHVASLVEEETRDPADMSPGEIARRIAWHERQLAELRGDNDV